MELTRYYLNIIRRWMWLLVLATLIATAASYWATKQEPPVYAAKARLVVGPGVDSPNPDLNALRTGGQLMQTYARLATLRPVLEMVVKDLDLNVSPDTLDGNIKVSADDETQILSIRVYHGDPERAVAIANTIADTLVRLSPSGASGAEAQLKEQMRRQASQLQVIIDNTEAEIAQLEADLQASTRVAVQHRMGNQASQDVIDSTETRIEQLEADLQAITDMKRQRVINSQVTQERIDTAEARIKQLEASLQTATDVETQHVILDEIAQERDRVSDMRRADLEREYLVLDQILQQIIDSTDKRIRQLETELQTATDIETQRLIRDQITLERSRLSSIQSTDLERQRLVLDQIVRESIDNTEARIKQLEADLQSTTNDVERQRLIVVQIAQERNHLSDVQRTDVERRRMILDQILQVIMTSSGTTIEQLGADLQAAADVATERLILDQVAAERDRLIAMHRTLAMLYTALQSGSTNQLKIVERAVIGEPVGSQLKLKLLMGGTAGLILALAIVLVFEYLDNTIETVEDLVGVTGVPVLGTIAKHKTLRGAGRKRLVIQALPQSRAAEDYRMLTTKLLFSRNQRPTQSVLVSSSEDSDKTDESAEIAANLAVSLAQAGNRVVLVDANLHHPTIGQLFDINDRHGLMDVLTGRHKLPRPISISWAPGLFVMPTGPVASDSFELLAAPQMAHLIRWLESDMDIVVITASPLASSAGTLLLASRMDGVILVARSGKTDREAARYTVEHLRSLSIHIIGTVLSNCRGRARFVSSPTAGPVLPADSRPADRYPIPHRLDGVGRQTTVIPPSQMAES